MVRVIWCTRYRHAHPSRNGKSPLKLIIASEGNEFWTMAASLGLALIILANQGATFLISS